MALGEAKVKAQEEFARELEATGYSLAADPGLRRGAPRAAAARSIRCRTSRVSSASRRSFVRHLGARMAAAGVPRAATAAESEAAATDPAAELAEVAS